MQAVEKLVRKDSFLHNAKALIDWNEVNRKVAIPRSRLGRMGYDADIMIRALVLARWYSLSDRQSEEALGKRLSFMSFCDLSLMDPCPDHATICRFRNALFRHGKYESLMEEIVRQLAELGFEVKNPDRAMVNARVVDSADELPDDDSKEF